MLPVRDERSEPGPAHHAGASLFAADLGGEQHGALEDVQLALGGACAPLASLLGTLLSLLDAPDAPAENAGDDMGDSATTSTTLVDADDPSAWHREGPVRLLQGGQWKRKNGPTACELCVLSSPASPFLPSRRTASSMLDRGAWSTAGRPALGASESADPVTPPPAAGSDACAAPDSRRAPRASPVRRNSLVSLPVSYTHLTLPTIYSV